MTKGGSNSVRFEEVSIRLPILGINNLNDSPFKGMKISLEQKKAISGLMKESERNSKAEICPLCSSKIYGVCNSHSIPRFVLKNISRDGMVTTSNAAIDFPYLESEKGIGKFETFRSICRDCDSRFFSDYEDPEKWNSEPTGKMLSQIALKNYLAIWSKREKEISMLGLIEEVLGKNGYLSDKQETNYIDESDYKRDIERHKSEALGDRASSFSIDLYLALPYRVPIAFQGPLAVIAGFDSSLINNIYNMNPKYEIQQLHIAIFPLRTGSIILLITKNEHKRYRGFMQRLRSLPMEEQLQIVQYLVLAYAEGVAFSPSIRGEITNDESIVSVMGKESTLFGFGEHSLADSARIAREEYTCEHAFEMTNLLSEEYAL